MKRLIFSMLILGLACNTVLAQGKKTKVAKMEPVLESGYYLITKSKKGQNDTVKGKIQTNPDDFLDFYKKFGFVDAKKGPKIVPMDSKKARGYGFTSAGSTHHFEVIDEEGVPVFAECLVRGRLNLYETRYDGEDLKGEPAVCSNFYVQDTRAEGKDAALKDLKKIKINRFYKKFLKDYMKDNESLWKELDKELWDKEHDEGLRKYLTKYLNEFNKGGSSSAGSESEEE
ncbi:MAG: hypothetical protein ACK46W_00085 [Bacteroidota bacterium]|jgi:hypothetical protein|nr:hypothetical protein [Sphingobacteriia bacterium]